MYCCDEKDARAYKDIVKVIFVIMEVQKSIFDNVVIVRRVKNLYVHIVLIRKGDNDIWLTEQDGIFVNGKPPTIITHRPYLSHDELYNDMCVIEAEVEYPFFVHLTLNGITRQMTVIETNDDPDTTLVATTMFKDDGYLIKDYVAHYQKLGVEHFYLYCNGDQGDNYPVMNCITYIKWPFSYAYDGRHYAQAGAIMDMLLRSKRSTTYVMFVDLDEYIQWTPKHITMKDFIVRNEFDVYAVLNNFVRIKDPSCGSSPADQIQQRAFTETFSLPFPSRSKCIVRPESVRYMGIHKPIDDLMHLSVCVLAPPTCDMFHVCNIAGRNHVSVNGGVMQIVDNITHAMRRTGILR